VAEQRSDDALRTSPRDFALLRASFEGQVIRIRHLLDLHADVDYCDKDGLTALHHAIFGGFEDAVQLLLDRGADTNASSPVAATPLHLAALKGRSEIAKILIGKYRAAVNAVDPDFGTPLHCAAFSGDVEIAKIMMKYGALVNSMCAVESSKQKWLTSFSLTERQGLQRPKRPNKLPLHTRHPFARRHPIEPGDHGKIPNQ
jgi:ankyrin repeat protein